MTTSANLSLGYVAVYAAGYVLAGLGIGLLTGTGSILYCFSLNYLPVSLMVTLSNLYIVITIVSASSYSTSPLRC